MAAFVAELAAARHIVVVVAHPDDETIWAGGVLLGAHPDEAFVASLCRGSDPDRAPKFRRVLEELQAVGAMGDMDDSPEQLPLAGVTVRGAVKSLLPARNWDLLITHGPRGEYTRHRRHEEVSCAVADLWRQGAITARELWMFAYDDARGTSDPRPRSDADVVLQLDEAAHSRKVRLVTGIYGFGQASFEARAAGSREAFYRFRTPEELARRIPALGGVPLP